MKQSKIKAVLVIGGLFLASYGNMASASVLTAPIQENKAQVVEASVYQPTEWQVSLLGVALVGMKLTRNSKNQDLLKLS